MLTRTQAPHPPRSSRSPAPREAVVAAGPALELDARRIVGHLQCPTRRVLADQALYHGGSPLRNLYAVRSGSFRTVFIDADGREQVTGFYMTGDLIGLDGMGADVHAATVIALEESTVWEIPFRSMQNVARADATIQSLVHRLLGREIQREQRAMLMLGTMTAEERVAGFLLDMSERYRERGFSPVRYNLPMRRSEIASYLGLKIETVSRMLTHYRSTGVIAVEGRYIEIRNRDALVALAGRTTLH